MHSGLLSTKLSFECRLLSELFASHQEVLLATQTTSLLRLLVPISSLNHVRASGFSSSPCDLSCDYVGSCQLHGLQGVESPLQEGFQLRERGELGAAANPLLPVHGASGRQTTERS